MKLPGFCSKCATPIPRARKYCDGCKPTWLYAVNTTRPDLTWGPSPQRIHPRALELHGYEKARRIGMVAMVGGKDKTRIRNATPEPFRDLLLSIARSAAQDSAARHTGESRASDSRRPVSPCTLAAGARSSLRRPPFSQGF